MNSVTIRCPYCWESVEIIVDGSIVRQEYTEDCQVCCRPIVITVRIMNGGTPHCEVRREEE